jgi:hypothetical protein
MSAPHGFALVSDASRFEEIVDRLPPAVRAKFLGLQDQRDRLHGALVAAQTTWQAGRRELTSAQAAATIAQDTDRRDVDRFNRTRQSGTPEPPSPRAAAALAALDRAREREASRRRARDESQTAWEVADRLLTAVRELLRTSDPALLVPVVVERRAAKAPREAAVDLERVRAEIAKLAAEHQALDVAPVPLAEAAARLDDFLDEAARQFDPATSYFTAASYTAPSLDDLLPYKLLTLLAALPEVRKAFHARVAAAYPKLPASVPTKDRAALRAQLLDRRRQLELAEEQIVLEGALAGATIPRRGDASPDVVVRAVLAE